MRLKRLSIIAVFIFLLTFAMPAALAVTPTEVDVPDTALNHALHDALGTSDTEPLLDTQLMMLENTLDLEGLGISDITGLEYLKGVDTFILAKNNISELTDAFCDMLAVSTVDNLNLSQNDLRTLPSGIQDSQLASLDLSLNQFYALPTAVTKIDSLTELDISGNRLSTLPPALADMPNLNVFEFEANRIKNLPSSFTGLSLNVFLCDYNFMDISAGSANKNILDSMSVGCSFFYENQLPPLAGLTVEYPETGTAFFHWDPAEDIVFSSGVTAKLMRVTILQDDIYIDNIPSDTLQYEINDLETGTEYNFSFSYDYHLLTTRYEDVYTRTYTTLTAVPQDAVAPTATPTPTLTPTPTVTPILQEEAQATDTPEEDPQDEAVQTVSTLTDTTIILLIVIAVLLIALIVVIILFIQKNKIKNNPAS